MEVVVVVVDMDSALDALGPPVADALEPFLPIETGPEAFRIVGTGNVGCVVFLFSGG